MQTTDKDFIKSSLGGLKVTCLLGKLIPLMECSSYFENQKGKSVSPPLKELTVTQACS